MGDLSNPLRGEEDVPGTPTAPKDDRVALCVGELLFDKATKGGMSIVADLSLVECKEIGWSGCLRRSSGSNLAKRAGAGSENWEAVPSVCVDFNNCEVGDELWRRNRMRGESRMRGVGLGTARGGEGRAARGETRCRRERARRVRNT